MLAAAGLALAACAPSNATSSAEAPTNSSVSTSSAQPSSKPDAESNQASAPAKPSGTPKKAGVSCTNQINYANDSRTNAEINTIGEDTGYCPPISTSTESNQTETSGTPKKAGVSCTNQINYANDSRTNAEINTIGEDTGYCPPISTSAESN
ncbi:hypothetical protein [Actinoplanes sp. NBRC 103695]|uniref:hypothetical protein n=1 Tax=Actinoplanes sp. NBRC 103695 TaxID=3032202 RepID=UPI0024A23C3C|nr:hypothetical protein [Actinoplanes sp. NBRC 103695]GLY97320.1 hypothetical protein Acsp02_45740 [Actinoplanes sp. NBRC 103695]